MRLLLIGLAILGMHVNMLVAMKTASIASDDDRNARETRILAASRISSYASACPIVVVTNDGTSEFACRML
jgi:hypothetical protein